MPPPTPSATNSEAGGQLFSRTFKLDWNTLAPVLGVTLQTNSPAALEEVPAALRERLAEAGWSPDTVKGESMYLNHRRGSLYARTTMANLDLVEVTLQKLRAVPQSTPLQTKTKQKASNQKRLLVDRQAKTLVQALQR